MSRIDPETLAALMEGRLSDDERARVLAVLAESDADLEILADAAVAAAALENDEGESDGPEGAAPLPGDGTPPTPSPETAAASPAEVRAGIRWKVWVPLAAAVAAVALIPSLLDGPDGAGLGQLRLDLVALGTVASPADLPAAAGGDLVRSGGAAGDLTDALAPEARSFRRGAVLARLTVLEPAAREASPEAAALNDLLRSAAGGAARPSLQAWLGDGADTEASWSAAAEALQQAEGAPAAFRLGLVVEGLSLSRAPGGLAEVPDSPWLEALEADFARLPSEVQAALEAEYRDLMGAMRAGTPDPAAVDDALEAFAAAVSALRDPSAPGA